MTLASPTEWVEDVAETNVEAILAVVVVGESVEAFTQTGLPKEGRPVVLAAAAFLERRLT